MKPFVVPVADLVHRPGARRRERLAAPLPGLSVSGSAVADGAPVEVSALLEWVEDGLLASGTVSSRWTGECRRCLAPVDGRLEVPFRELFEHRFREGESYPLRPDSVDLEPLAREAVLLELPLAPLCSPGCQGLCPVCGADRNHTECGCQQPERDPRWAALDQLRLEPGHGPGRDG